MTEKVFKEFIARLEDATINYQIHKSNVWLEQVEVSRKVLLKIFKEQQQEIERLKKDKQSFGNIISVDARRSKKGNLFFKGYSGIKKYFNV